MPLKLNSLAPDFTVSSADNLEFNLYQKLETGPVVLFFYPRDFTIGCTRQVCAFRDDFSFFENRNLKVAGISGNSIRSHHHFGQEHRLPFSLLSDPNHDVARLYKAMYPFNLLAMRVTYLINMDRQILSVFNSYSRAEKHVVDLKQKLLQPQFAAQLGL